MTEIGEQPQVRRLLGGLIQAGASTYGRTNKVKVSSTFRKPYDKIILAVVEHEEQKHDPVVVTEETLARLLEEYPLLNQNGMGASYATRGRAEREAEIARYRERFTDRSAQVQLCADWLCRQRWNIRPGENFTSYGLKHIVEEETGQYVSNGDFIAAAILVGVPWAPSGTLNPHIGLDKGALRQKYGYRV
jgi:hypothetical protein